MGNDIPTISEMCPIMNRPRLSLSSVKFCKYGSKILSKFAILLVLKYSETMNMVDAIMSANLTNCAF